MEPLAYAATGALIGLGCYCFGYWRGCRAHCFCNGWLHHIKTELKKNPLT